MFHFALISVSTRQMHKAVVVINLVLSSVLVVSCVSICSLAEFSQHCLVVHVVTETEA